MVKLNFPGSHSESLTADANGSREALSEPQLKAARDRLFVTVRQMRQATGLRELLETTVNAVRSSLAVDRVLLYRFDVEGRGEVAAEAVGRKWTPALGQAIDPLCFGAEAADYLEQRFVVINCVSQAELTPHQLQLLDQFQVHSSLSVPVLVDRQLWGLLVAHHCEAAQVWRQAEITLLYQIATELTTALQPFEFALKLQRQAQQEQAVAKVIDRIRRSLDIDTIFRTTTQEVRQLLGVERVTIYKFRPDYFGDFVVESESGGYPKLVGSGWEDPYLNEHQGGRFRNNEPFVVDDIYHGDMTDCHIEALEYFGVKSCLVVAIIQGQKLWGLLSAFQHSGPRHWEAGEVRLLSQVGTQLGVALQQAEYLEQVRAQSEELAKTAEREKALTQVITRIRQSLDLETIFKATTREVRKLLKADRVGVFKFNPDSGFDDGEFVSEDVQPGFTSALAAKIHDHCFGEQFAAYYSQGKTHAVSDIYTAGLSDCHIDILAQFQVRANLIVPLLKGNELWGLLCIHQCSESRQWQQAEIEFVKQIAAQFCVALQQVEYLEQLKAQSVQLARQAERERNFVQIVDKVGQSIIDKIRLSQDIETIFGLTTQQVRQLLQTDRVAVYRFNPDWSGEFVAESVANGWGHLVGIDIKTVWADSYLQETQGGRYRRNETFVVEDIHTIGHSPCHIEILEQFEIRAYVLVPIFAGETLWGLLAAYQNSGPRHWEESEVKLLAQVGIQLGVALRQAEYLEQLKAQSAQLVQAAERERATARVIDKIRQSLDIDTIFRATTQEVRQILKADRVAVYRFNPDWSGEFVAESVAIGWTRVVGQGINTVWEDSHLKETQGGRYRHNETSVVEDIHAIGHAPCHIEILEQFQARAYIIVPVFAGDKLWGLLAAYQNTGPRSWEESEVSLLTQIGIQLGVALKQAQYLEQVRSQSVQLAQVAEREKTAKEQLQQRAMQLLAAVQPVFNGDLTVCAPVTEDEVGIIADAYNNTIQSLRKIVLQVQTAAAQVAQTSRSSEASIADLSAQAQQQFQELTLTLNQIQEMVHSTQAVAANAQQVEVAVQRANQTVQTGDAAMNRTVDGILEIRETVAETGKKIKRLSESSQKISKVVSLIGNFTTQTQLLAINASIEATRAGEYGRGFAVVADEVRSLARQSAAATTEIENLVQEIQAETSDVTAAMETGIQRVVEGTHLVNETRQSLNEIVAATAQISQLVEGITQTTRLQTQQSELVTQTMTAVAEIANHTSEDSVQISASFKALLAMAEGLQESVGQFKVN